MIGPIPVTFWPGMLIALPLLIAASWFLVRHAGLAALTALSPLPGLVLAGLGYGLPPSVFDYLPSFISAGILASTIAPLAANALARQAVRQSLRDLWPVFVTVFLSFVPAILVDHAALRCLAGEISAVAVTAVGAMLLSYDEDFVVRINRAMEARLRETERLDFLTQSRWGMSIGGVALVFSVLGFLGAQTSLSTITSHAVLFVLVALIFMAGALAVTRNVRRGLAAVLAMAPVTLLIFALSVRFLHSAMLLLLLAVAAIPVLFMAASALSFERSGDRWDVATQRGIARFGPSVAVTMLASAAAAVLSGWFSQTAIVEGVALLLGGIAALILQPALTTMLYALFRKRVSLEEAFRKR